MQEQPQPSRLWRWAIPVALLGLLVIAAMSAVAGYASGIDRRTNFESTQVASAVSEQYNLGVQDLEAKRFELARQRFEYVIQLDPAYPGVTDKLALVLLELNTTATPTAVPTPTLTPTVDLRSAEELYSQAQVLLADGKWTEAIDTLLRLRKNEPNYEAIKVDSMLFVALRNRGIDRILKDGDLEGGTYDLAVAERFGPLDVEADNMRTWADLYATGASFWGLDWPKVLEYFSQIILLAPNLRDSTNMTATERYRVASIRYGDFLASNGDWCSALEQYQAALEMGSDPSIEPTASWVENKCQEDQKEEDEGDEEPTETPPTEGTPSPETPTEPPPTESTPTPETPQPTEPYPAP
jgi:tetratricopeptide (TPR) repeat protein